MKHQITIDDVTYQIPYGTLGYIPKGKKEKRKLLMRYITNACKQRWYSELPKEMANLERKIIEELIEHL